MRNSNSFAKRFESTLVRSHRTVSAPVVATAMSWKYQRLVRGVSLAVFALTLLDLNIPSQAQEPVLAKDPQIGQSFPIPYRRTLTNHYLVRVRINGKGPFNFLVDTGAPALYVSTAAARKIGLKTEAGEFWTPIDRFDLEGGIRLTNLKGRVEDPFQLEGMNALGLPGATIDGILGFTVLARFKMEFDPRSDRMTWTRLDYEPKEPFVPKDPVDRQAPAEVQAMNMLGPAMKLAAVFLGKQPEDLKQPQGVLGLTLTETSTGSERTVQVSQVWPGSAALEAGILVGDRLVSLGKHPVTSLQAAHEAILQLKPGDSLDLVVLRGGDRLERSLKAGTGF